MYLMTHFPATGPYLLFSCPSASVAPFPSNISKSPTAETSPNSIEIGQRTFVIRVIPIIEGLFVYFSGLICWSALFLFYFISPSKALTTENSAPTPSHRVELNQESLHILFLPLFLHYFLYWCRHRPSLLTFSVRCLPEDCSL